VPLDSITRFENPANAVKNPVNPVSERRAGTS
jgi:hypothetical protein